MNLKSVQKFDKLIQKTTNKKLKTFDEITYIIINLMKMEVNANHNELMQRVSQNTQFGSADEIQDFLNGYFEFHNALVAEFDAMEIVDDNLFDKKILAFTKNLLTTVPKDRLQETMAKFISDIVDAVMDEYPIAHTMSSDDNIEVLGKIFGSEDIAMLFMTVVMFMQKMQEDDLKYELIIEMTSSIFVFCMAMNSLRKENYQNSLENQTTTQNSANSISYNVGRNDPCPCGSGRKYKKCCLNRDKLKPLDMIKFEEPKDILAPFKRDEMHEFYVIWSRFLNFVSKAYAGAVGEEPIKIYDKKSNGDYYLTDEAMKTYHYLTIRNFLDEYFFMLVEHFIDDNSVSQKNIDILYEIRDTYKNIDVFSFEMFSNGNAVFYNPDNKSCFYVHKTYYDYSKVFPKAKLIQTMFFSYKGRIITDGIAASPRVEMGENMQNVIKEEYEEVRGNLTYSLEINEPPKQSIYQLKISIKGAKPPIWRRVLVEPTIKFSELHNIIQDMFNWEDYHLYMFMSKKASYTSRESLEEVMFGGNKELPSDEYSIKTELNDIKDNIKYIYDFGDSWKHDIVLEKILPYDSKINYPICTGGRREGPMEDSGGIYYYNEIVQAIENPSFDNQHYLGEDEENWYEGFVPSSFDKDEVNFILGNDKYENDV